MCFYQSAQSVRDVDGASWVCKWDYSAESLLLVASIHAGDHMDPGNVLPIGQAGNLASDE